MCFGSVYILMVAENWLSSYSKLEPVALSSSSTVSIPGPCVLLVVAESTLVSYTPLETTAVTSVAYEGRSQLLAIIDRRIRTAA
jgi:hypothetical protein